MIVRAISGLFFIAIVIGAVMWSFESMVLLFNIIVFIGGYEFYLLRIKTNPGLKLWAILLSVGLFFAVLILAAQPIYPSPYPESPRIPEYAYLEANQNLHYDLISVAAILLFLVLIISDLFNKKQTNFVNTANGIFAMLYIALPFGLLSYLCYYPGYRFLKPENILYFFILLWTNDTFAYLTGKFLGKNKLWERISPKKTWEGFFGGMIFTILAAILILYYLEKNLNWLSAIPAIIISVFATLGDLSESLLKRQAGVKDSGNIIPGHGGILDRFDGVLLSTPALFFTFYLIHLFQ